MESLVNKLTFATFDIIAAAKGYTFRKVDSEARQAHADLIYGEEGLSFPEHLVEENNKFKAGTLNYIAYYKGKPAGLIRMANPKVINRAWEHYGVDKEGHHHEIQSLVVRPRFRDGAQFVMLGLVKKIFTYSVVNNIKTWSACGKRSIYLTMRRYNKDIEVIDVDFKSIDHPITRFLVANNVVETYFIMSVGSFAPWQILKKCVKKMMKKWSITAFADLSQNNNTPSVELFAKSN